jgi:hypothetical protein
MENGNLPHIEDLATTPLSRNLGKPTLLPLCTRCNVCRATEI